MGCGYAHEKSKTLQYIQKITMSNQKIQDDKMYFK